MSSDAVTAAYDHVGAHRIDFAVAMLETAGDHGDAVALAELAAWYLRGDLVPRDLARARAVLRRAVAIGHVDAALREAALTANGTGSPADWPSAVSLLRHAAKRDPLAGQHLALLNTMDLSPEGYPVALPRVDLLSDRPIILRVRNALSPAECQHVANVAYADLMPAVVIDPNSGRQMTNPIRTSHGAAIGPAQEDLVIGALNRRLAALTKTPVENGEPLQVLRYMPGQQYRLHSDAIVGATNQRTVTAIAYLNDGFAGGETDFPALGIRVQPRAGDVLIFHNTAPDGQAESATRHAGLPVTQGVKWIATRWIRARRYDAWNPPRP